MLVSMIIVFREALEAGLIVGIVLAATEGINRRGRWIAGGIAAGVAGASLIAVFAGALSDLFEGAGQEAFTAAILCFAVVMLTWHVVWMSHHARQMTTELRRVGQAVRLGQSSLAALAGVVAVAVMREGAEVVLFLYGIVAASHTAPMPIAGGGIVGLLLASFASWLLYRGLVAIPLTRLFAVTNGLVTLLAAGMAGQAVAILHGADMLPAWHEHLWNTSFIIADDSYVGRSLHALVGYSARPSGIQLAAWAATLLVITFLSHLFGRPKGRPLTRSVVLAGVLAASWLLQMSPSHADEIPLIVFHDHRFVPDHITVPANVKFQLKVMNSDNTADEFESTDLNREKLVAPGQTITVFLGPLDPGSYKFFGDFHQATAQGVMMAK